MGIYLNPVSETFKMSLRSPIYVDKSGLIAKMNAIIGTEQRYICVSRPRRFGKSMAANMLAAYYGCGEETDDLFRNLMISSEPSYKIHLNHYDVVMVNMQGFLSKSRTVQDMLTILQERVLKEMKMTYPEINMDGTHLDWAMEDIHAQTNKPFIILIDEWDCMFREYQQDTKAQRTYLDFLRTWLKDKPYVSLAYMTGILPIKKYGSHSALNMFSEYSMTNAGRLSTFFGFTEIEVRDLCSRHNMNFEETKAWYDGYTLRTGEKIESIYSPKSVVEAMLNQEFRNYWNQTETYEALKVYIQMNFDGLKDAVITMLAGGSAKADVSGFENDMTTFQCLDDVFALLVHLGYLTYDAVTECVEIPNKEVSAEYVTAIRRSQGWDEVIHSINDSQNLLEALWNQDTEAVAEGIDRAHQEVSILQYNDENALSYTISLAFYFAKNYYTLIRELPSGRGFADICMIPRKLHADKPAVLIELKWDKTVRGALDQIKDRQYVAALQEYKGNLLLVGINYDPKKKVHTCEIEKVCYPLCE